MRASKNARTACLEQTALAGWRRSLAQIAPDYLDITAIGQLTTAQLAFGNHLEPPAADGDHTSATVSIQ